MLAPMKTSTSFARWAPAVAGSLFLLSGAARPAVWMDGEVTLDYYVADVDTEGFELTDAELFVERIVNDGAAASGPLSLSGWLTGQPSPAGAGDEAGYAPLGSIPGHSTLLDTWETVAADDVAPGEYFPHVLLQDDDYPGTFEDARSLAPLLLWRGGLEATGPLYLVPYAGGYDVTVDFAALRNNRLDSRYTNDIVLTLYATYGYGPASNGYTLCERVVPGLYAGDWRNMPDFDCALSPVPDGVYTVHLQVAEDGGRGGHSTLSGPDVRFVNGHIDDGYGDGAVYVSAGATSPLLLAALLGLALLRAQALRRRAWLTIERIRAG